MYTKDKTCRFSFRVNETLYKWAEKRASALGVSPCDFVRNILFSQMNAEIMLGSVETNNHCRDCEVKNEDIKDNQ